MRAMVTAMATVTATAAATATVTATATARATATAMAMVLATSMVMVMATAMAMLKVTMWAMMMAMRLVGNEEGKGKGGKGNDDGNVGCKRQRGRGPQCNKGGR
jgi:hypothetical protein